MPRLEAAGNPAPRTPSKPDIGDHFELAVVAKPDFDPSELAAEARHLCCEGVHHLGDQPFPGAGWDAR